MRGAPLTKVAVTYQEDGIGSETSALHKYIELARVSADCFKSYESGTAADSSPRKHSVCLWGLLSVRLTSFVLMTPSSSFRYMPVVSPSSCELAARKLGLSKVKVATPVLPSTERVSLTSGTTGSGTPWMNSMKASAAH